MSIFLIVFLVCISLPFLGLGAVFTACCVRHVRRMMAQQKAFEERHKEMQEEIKRGGRHTNGRIL